MNILWRTVSLVLLIADPLDDFLEAGTLAVHQDAHPVYLSCEPNHQEYGQEKNSDGSCHLNEWRKKHANAKKHQNGSEKGNQRKNNRKCAVWCSYHEHDEQNRNHQKHGHRKEELLGFLF